MPGMLQVTTAADEDSLSACLSSGRPLSGLCLASAENKMTRFRRSRPAGQQGATIPILQTGCGGYCAAQELLRHQSLVLRCCALYETGFLQY